METTGPVDTSLKPPRLAAWLLSRLIDAVVRDQAMGDLEERFRVEAGERSLLWARAWYRVQIWPVLISFIENTLLWEASMFKNYLKTGWRNIKAQKGYSFINIAGLALGMACAILIVFYIHYELSFDRFHKNADRIYRVVVDATLQQNQVNVPAAQMAFGPTLAKDYPEVTAAVRVQSLSKTMVKYADRSFYETGLLYADASIFDVFTFPLVAGDPMTALARANTVVLTERMAKKYFRGENPVGKFLRFNDETDFTVTGVMKDIPSPSHLQFDCLVSLETRFGRNPDLRQDWMNINTPTYVLFRDRRGPEEIEPKLVALVEERLASFLKALGGTLKYSFQPLAKVHLFSRFSIDFVANSGNIQYIYAFAVIALFIVGIACMNFMNLATARSAKRAREIGLRKVVGARRLELFGQFLGEATTHSLLSLIVALILVRLALPFFKSISGIDLRLGASQLAWLVPSFFGLALLVSLVAGSYPAAYLSALQPASTLKGSWKAGPGSARFRHVLVVVQFLIGIALIIGTAVVRRQLDFMRNRNLGFSMEQVLVTQIDDPTIFPRVETVKARLKEIPGVVSAALTQAVPGQMTEANVQPFVPEGVLESEPLLFRQFSVDADFVPTIGMEIVQGRNFSRELPTDADALLINEATARKLGWADPVGRKIKVPTAGEAGLGWREKTVIGVIRDFHFLGLRELIEPCLLDLGTQMDQLLIKLKTERLSATVRELERAWGEIDPVRPLDFFFLDGFFDAQYRTEERLSRLITAFSGLAVAIACLGLFGLASFLAEQRAKEIAIRKVLGASIRGVLARLSLEFLKLVALAILLAWPVAYFAMGAWLRNFSYRAALSPWTFLTAGLAALAIAFLTVAGQAYRAASSNPVESLKYE
ncbi:MAG: ABC transporter permease [Candidatus Aminicenantes bacterium]|nr:ABC transporter permease [Candidatus Aminicenantes bacterium]